MSLTDVQVPQQEDQARYLTRLAAAQVPGATHRRALAGLAQGVINAVVLPNAAIAPDIVRPLVAELQEIAYVGLLAIEN